MINNLWKEKSPWIQPSAHLPETHALSSVSIALPRFDPLRRGVGLEAAEGQAHVAHAHLTHFSRGIHPGFSKEKTWELLPKDIFYNYHQHSSTIYMIL